MILPYFDYADVIYHTAGNEGIEKLQRLQNRCLKICKGVNIRFGTKDLHSSTKVLMLRVRRGVHISNFMFGRSSREKLMDGRNISTRAHDAPLFKLKVPRVEAYKRSVEYVGSLCWNTLPSELRNIKDSKIFKARQKAIMLESVE